jgi:hypothetical protein
MIKTDVFVRWYLKMYYFCILNKCSRFANSEHLIINY